MAKFSQQFLKPGRYCIGKNEQGKKVYRDFSAAELQEYVAGTAGMIQSGYCPFIFAEHKAANTAEGAPVQLSTAEKEVQVRNAAGWLTSAVVGDDGAALYHLNVTDPTIAGKLKNGSIRFTSPELREEWTDGNGKTHKKVIAHVALTHKPRAIDQGPIKEAEPALQFSLADLVVAKGTPKQKPPAAIQLSDDEEKPFEKKDEAKDEVTGETPEAKPEPKPQNPDLPAEEEQDSADVQQFEAMRVMGKEVLGFDLPADATPDTLVRDLLLVFKTIKAQQEKQAAEEAEENKEDDELEGAYEDAGLPMQFSLADTERADFANKLLARAIKSEHAILSHRFEKLVGNDRITPAFRDELIGNGGALQFSADGDVTTTFTLPQVLDLLEKFTVEGQSLDATQLSMATEEEHPAGDEFWQDNTTKTGAPSEAAQEKAAAEQVKRHPALYRS